MDYQRFRENVMAEAPKGSSETRVVRARLLDVADAWGFKDEVEALLGEELYAAVVEGVMHRSSVASLVARPG